MLKKLLLLTTSLLFGFGLQAQNPMGTSNEVFVGANGAKTTFLRQATMAYPEFLSEDARYLTGMFGGGLGYFYDFTKDTCVIFENHMISGYVAADHYAGQDDPGETYSNSFVYYKGDSIPLEKVINYYRASYNEVFITAVQPNLDNIVAMVYDTVYKYSDGRPCLFNYPAIYDGKTGKCLLKLPFVWEPSMDDEERIGFGARGDCISGDGKIIGGHCTDPFARGKWSLAFWDISDPNDIKAFGFGENGGINGIGAGYGFGSLYGINYDGSLIAGGSQTNGYGVIVHYDRANKVVSEIDTVAPLASWDFLTFSAISNDGIAIGYCGMNLDPGTREPVVYSKLTGLVKMTDFLYEYYNIDVRKNDLYTPMFISRNGLLMIGFFDDGGYPVPYTNRLSAERILPRARKISARAARGEVRAVITWQEPLKSNLTLTGYNIYRDDEKTPLNGNTVLPVSTGSYEDLEADGLTKGKHTYYIEAVYGDQKSDKQASNAIQVVGPGDAFPVQTINHRLDYNRFANIYWGMPSSEIVALAKNDLVTPAKDAKGQFERAVENTDAPVAEAAAVETKNAPAPKAYINTTLDYIANVDMLTYSGYDAIKIGDYYYTTSHRGGGITIIDQFNEVVRVIAPSGLGIVMSMVYFEEENVLFCGTGKDIKILDLETEKVTETYPDIPARFLAYIPDADGLGNEGFVAGSIHSCNLYGWEINEEGDRDLVLKEENILDFGPLYACGAAYYEGRLYVSSASGPYMNEVYVYDFAKRTQIGDPIQVVEDPALYNLLTDNGDSYLVSTLASSTQAGGLSIAKLEDGTTALGMVFQCYYFTTRFMLLELESNEDVKGYNLHRSVNGGEYTQVNTEPMTSRRYIETLTDAGKYTYYVEVVSENNSLSEPSPTDTITIADQGTCPKPDFTAKESNNWPVLDWMPGSSEKALVGFDLYRAEDHLGRFWLTDMRLNYIDDEITELGTYTYRLEVLYEDGCVSENTASITLTGEGIAKEPFGLTLTKKDIANNKEACDITVKWETPMWEEPLSLRYCNGVSAQAVAFENFYACWAAIGWDTANIDLYRDLYLVGMEYLIGATPTLFEGFVLLNDQFVYTHPIARPIAGEWQTVLFDKSFSMDQPHEVVVGYHTTYTAANTGLLLVDNSVSKSGYSDLVSLDGYQWSTLKAGGHAGSWMIGALVVRKRDLDNAKNADGSINYQKLEGSIMRMANGQPLNARIQTMPTTFDVKPSTKAPLNLTGFNVYRKLASDDGSEVKLNNELMTTFELTDPAVVKDEYEYSVGAVYADGREIKARKFIDLYLANEGLTETLNLNVYPNPVTEWLNVEGEYETLQIFDFGGRLLRTCQAASQIQLGDLKTGTYFLHFTGADARKAVYKIVVR